MLGVLVKYLTTDKDGETRYTETLKDNKEFRAAKKDYQQAWKPIAAELQHFGGDTLVNLVRRTGVEYREILIDVCKKLKIKTNYKAEAVDIEQALLAKLFQDSWEKMSEEERDELRKQFKVDSLLTSSAALAVIIASIRNGGYMSYQITMIVANAVSKALLGRSLTIPVNAGVIQTTSVFAGPIGMAIAALLTIPAISGPAFRVTLPAVIQVAAMRQQMLNEEEPVF
ncbi:ubiquinol-cytochrome C chaperone [Vibrio sp. 10N.222.55.C12]|nr:ubiquinol-cytochrome C chaperone [Vibrio sp. 10N.222.55.C12]